MKSITAISAILIAVMITLFSIILFVSTSEQRQFCQEWNTNKEAFMKKNGLEGKSVMEIAKRLQADNQFQYEVGKQNAERNAYYAAAEIKWKDSSFYFFFATISYITTFSPPYLIQTASFFVPALVEILILIALAVVFLILDKKDKKVQAEKPQ